MKNFTKIGMSLFVVIAFILLGSGILHAKGAIHGTLTLIDGPPNITLPLFLQTLKGGVQGPCSEGGVLFTNKPAKFDANGTALVHFAMASQASCDVEDLSMIITVLSKDKTTILFTTNFVPLDDVDNDGVIGSKDYQDLGAILIAL